MQRLSELKLATPPECEWLQQKLDSMAPSQPLLFDNIAMYSGCSPGSGTVGFFSDEPGYVMFLAEKISYSGSDPLLAKLFDDGLHVTTTWPEMTSFFQQLPDEDLSEPDKPPDETDITDFSAISMPEPEIATLDFETIRRELKKTVIGQDFAVDCVACQLAAYLSKPNPTRPLSLLFHGDPATGKSELAKAAGDLLSHNTGHPYKVVWTDLNTFTEAHTVHNLTGAPASYIGHDETPVFHSVVENPYVLFIWDEVEKAHPTILKLFMGIMDEGRCASNKELSDHTREYNFKHSIHIFTTNSPIGQLSGAKKNPIGFVSSTNIKEVSYADDDSVTVEYATNEAKAEPALAQRMYEANEKARHALVKTGVLPEIATRFSGFVEFKPLKDNAKIRIIAKTILNTGFEYDIKLKYIAPGIIQELINAAGKDSFSVRSYRAIVEGYLATAFAATEGVSGGDTGEFRLEGTLAQPELIPA